MPRRGFILLFVVVFFLTAASNIDKIHLHLTNKQVAFTFIHLRDGEATLIQNPKHNILINTGSDESEYQLRDQLAVYGVKKIDQLILTNAGESYTGNISDILRDYHVQSVSSSKTIMKQIQKKYHLDDDNVQILKHGTKQDMLPGLRTDVLYSSPENEGGLALRFTFGSQKVLYMGVANRSVEKKVMKNGPVQSQILKVGEYGEKKGTMPSFLKKVDPEIAILFHKEGLLPSDQMIERLQEIWIDIHQPRRNGSVTVKFSPHSYKVFTLPAP